MGDSKGFIGRSGKLHQMTKAHSLIDQLVDDHVISAEDAEQLQGGKNIILRALGAEATVKVDYSEGPLTEGDVVVPLNCVEPRINPSSPRITRFGCPLR